MTQSEAIPLPESGLRHCDVVAEFYMRNFNKNQTANKFFLKKRTVMARNARFQRDMTAQDVPSLYGQCPGQVFPVFFQSVSQCPGPMPMAAGKS